MYKQVCLWEGVKVKFYRETFTMCGAGCVGGFCIIFCCPEDNHFEKVKYICKKRAMPVAQLLIADSYRLRVKDTNNGLHCRRSNWVRDNRYWWFHNLFDWIYSNSSRTWKSVGGINNFCFNPVSMKYLASNFSLNSLDACCKIYLTSSNVKSRFLLRASLYPIGCKSCCNVDFIPYRV